MHYGMVLTAGAHARHGIEGRIVGGIGRVVVHGKYSKLLGGVCQALCAAGGTLPHDGVLSVVATLEVLPGALATGVATGGLAEHPVLMLGVGAVTNPATRLDLDARGAARRGAPHGLGLQPPHPVVAVVSANEGVGNLVEDNVPDGRLGVNEGQGHAEGDCVGAMVA